LIILLIINCDEFKSFTRYIFYYIELTDCITDCILPSNIITIFNAIQNPTKHMNTWLLLCILP